MSQLSTYVYPGAWVFVTQEALRASTPNGQFEKLEPKVKEGLIRLAANLESNREISIIEGEREDVVFFPAGTMSINKVKAFVESSDPWSYTRCAEEFEENPLSGRVSHFVPLTRDIVLSSLMKNI